MLVDFRFWKKEKQNKEKKPKPKEYPTYVVTLDEDTFDEFINKYPLSMVDFWASWCKPCKTMYPRLRRLSKIYKRKVAFGRINIKENEAIAKEYKVRSIPYFALFQYGKEIASITGVQSIGDMKKTIKELLEE